MSLRLILLTALTMLAFAANSLFCRFALLNSANSPISFTMVRLFSGAGILSFFFVKYKKSESLKLKKNIFLAPLVLFSYALFFSLSYVKISAGSGALILFASVQLTMMAVAFWRGLTMSRYEKLGMAMAICGFLYLVLPGINTPPPVASVLMGIAGVSWGIYSLLGQTESDPIFATSRNFIFTLPLVILLCLFFPIKLTSAGILLAILSGALTSGMGYVLWYIVLKDLKTSTAAIIQLSVPALAAIGGVLFLGENIKLRLVVASMLIISGIFIKVNNKSQV